jgi:hypothetical protein
MHRWSLITLHHQAVPWLWYQTWQEIPTTASIMPLLVWLDTSNNSNVRHHDTLELLDVVGTTAGRANQVV